MPSLREIVQQRARVPAKVHDMEAVPGRAQNVPSASGPSGGPIIVQYAATQTAPAPGDAAPSGARPPRPAASGASPPAPLRKASEVRKPRSGSEPGRRIHSGRNQSGAGQGTSEDAGDGQPPAPRAKARSSSVRARISDAAPPVDRNDIGKVPIYLRRRQEEAAEEKRRAARPASPVAPAGYRKVDDAEKQATLAVLRQRKSEVEAAQRKLPFKIETSGQKQREKDLSDRVMHLDKLLGMFCQPVVFIPADASPIASVPPPPSPMPVVASRDLAARVARISEDGPAVSEDSHDSHPSRQPQARGGIVGDRQEEVNAPCQSNREMANRQNYARANQNLSSQIRLADPPPWDARSDVSSNVRTGVKVAAPPGGISTLSLAWG